LPEKEIEIKLEISKKAGLLRKPIKFVDAPGIDNNLYLKFLFTFSLYDLILQKVGYMKLLNEMKISGWIILTRIQFTGEFKLQLTCPRKK